jgi:hypothetical protein
MELFVKDVEVEKLGPIGVTIKAALPSEIIDDDAHEHE